jgi:hypothetical protein
MTLHQLAKKLRAVADTLDDLLGVDLAKATIHETPATAHKIRATFKRTPHKRRGPYKKKVAVTVAKKPLHWTQTAEGRRRMSRLQKIAWRKRGATEKSEAA